MTTRTATRFSSVCSWSSGWSIVAVCDASAEMTWVTWREYGLAALTRCWAFTMREAAMSSIARVIFFVDVTDRMRRR